MDWVEHLRSISFRIRQDATGHVVVKMDQWSSFGVLEPSI